MISLSNWANALERVLNLGLPWRVLRPQLTSSTQSGMLDYQRWIRELSITEPKLEVSLPFFSCHLGLLPLKCKMAVDYAIIFS